MRGRLSSGPSCRTRVGHITGPPETHRRRAGLLGQASLVLLSSSPPCPPPSCLLTQHSPHALITYLLEQEALAVGITGQAGTLPSRLSASRV